MKPTRTAFLEAAGTIRSDHYRAQTLLAGLKSDKLSKEALAVGAQRGWRDLFGSLQNPGSSEGG